jgi:acetolactate synthase I/II/III large subunit
LQRGYLDGRELAAEFRDPETGQPCNPDFAALARSCGDGARGLTAPAIWATPPNPRSPAGKPYLIDANIGADLNPSGAGVWEPPWLGRSRPLIGGRYEP